MRNSGERGEIEDVVSLLPGANPSPYLVGSVRCLFVERISPSPVVSGLSSRATVGQRLGMAERFPLSIRPNVLERRASAAMTTSYSNKRLTSAPSTVHLDAAEVRWKESC